MKLFRSLAHLILPDHCRSCKKQLLFSENHICLACQYFLAKTDYELDHDNALIQRLYGRIPIQYALALYYRRSAGRSQEIINQIKYHNHPKTGYILGKDYGAYIRNIYSNTFDCVIPVPLHPRKKRQRGYNQSDAWAEGLASGLQISCYTKGLKKLKYTKPQTQQGQLQRFMVIDGIFHVTDPNIIQGKHCLLVDDVLTTGATIEACANTLLQFGAESVSVCVLTVSD